MPINPQNDLINELVQPVASFIHQFIPGRGCRKVNIPISDWLSFQKILKTTRKKLLPLSNRLTAQIDSYQQQLHSPLPKIPSDHKIRIEVERTKLLSRTRGEIIPATALIQIPFQPAVTIPCYVSSGHWGKLREVEGHTINLIDHLDKLILQTAKIGLATYQNGIMNKYESEFFGNFASVVKQFPEGTLCIGLYNHTTSFLPKDMSRFVNEPALNRESTYCLFHLLLTLSEILPLINPHVLWTHFAHSEAGLIAHSVFKLLEQHGGYSSNILDTARKFIKKQLITCTYGAVHPVPDDPIYLAINTYTDRDIALTLGEKFIDRDLSKTLEQTFTSKKRVKDKTYTIKVVKTKLSTEPFLGVKFEPPHRSLTIQEKIDMTWVDRLAQLMRLEEGSPHISYQASTTLIDTINAKVFSIQDHGFSEVTYQKALKDDVQFLKEE